MSMFEDDATLLFIGQGDDGPRGGPPCDLYVHVRVRARTQPPAGWREARPRRGARQRRSVDVWEHLREEIRAGWNAARAR